MRFNYVLIWWVVVLGVILPLGFVQVRRRRDHRLAERLRQMGAETDAAMRAYRRLRQVLPYGGAVGPLKICMSRQGEAQCVCVTRWGKGGQFLGCELKLDISLAWPAGEEIRLQRGESRHTDAYLLETLDELLPELEEQLRTSARQANLRLPLHA